jgi:thioredoxin-related protein
VSTIILLSLLLMFQGTKTPPAQTIIDRALKTAKAENKTLFVHFGASWCEWCKQLDAMLSSKEIGKLISDNFVLVNLTVQESDDKKALENPGAQEIMERNGAGKAGVPYYLFLDKDGKKIADSLAMPKGGNIGYPATPEEIKTFEGLLPKAAPRMTAAQRATISDYLRKHAPKQQ